MEFSHASVMAVESVELLNCVPGGVYVDATVGGGGHAEEILKRSSPDGRLVCLDRDEEAIRAAGERLKPYGERATLIKENFSNVREALSRAGIDKVDGVIFDLGVSSRQFDTPERGFSFRTSGPLDMRMDRDEKVTAADLVNTLDKGELVRILRDYGEEREAGRIVSAIVRAREKKRIETTGELADIVSSVTPASFLRKWKIHPATRTFQALRIAVNRELEGVRAGLEGAFASLKKGGRLCAISFHSLEDRIVKETFREFSTGCVCPPKAPICICGRSPAARVVTKKAITPSEEEIKLNPRARSAKLRCLERL